jgi:hypothetical protein
MKVIAGLGRLKVQILSKPAPATALSMKASLLTSVRWRSAQTEIRDQFLQIIGYVWKFVAATSNARQPHAAQVGNDHVVSLGKFWGDKGGPAKSAAAGDARIAIFAGGEVRCALDLDTGSN